jgi:glycosyltransferase involved in cell wall biosynthesis
MTATLEERPRVLLLTSSAFNTYSGGGITLSNLFRGWPRDRLAVVHNDPLPPDTEPCARYYLLREEELGWQWPLRAWARKRSSPPSSGVVEASSTASPPARRRGRRGLQRALTLITSEGGLQDRAGLTPELRTWVADFAPQVIYTFLGSLGFVRLARALADDSGAALVVHMMDDWPSTRYRGGLLGPWLRATLDRDLREVFARATVRLGIGADMCAEYGRRYGREFAPFHNVLELDAWRPHVRRDWRVSSPLQVLYAGSILEYAQRDALLDVARAVGELRAEGVDVTLQLQTPFGRADAQRGHFETLPGVVWGEAPDEATIAARLASADVLLLPVNFDARTVDYVRLSFPTKLPAYLLSGTPVLAYGPEAVAQIRLARDEGWGQVVGRRDSGALKQALRDLASDADRRERLGRRAQEVAARDHDAARVRPLFQAAIAGAAASRARV